MKKRNLTAAFLVCALCAVMMTATGCGAQPRYADGAGAAATKSLAHEVASSYEAEADSSVDAKADTAGEQEPAQVETEIAVKPSPEDEDSSSPKPSTQAAYQQEAKKVIQKSDAIPQQTAQPETEVVSLEADPNDEIPFVIDAVPAETETEDDTTKASTITINGVEISYANAEGATTAPDSGAGLWKGSDSTTDGSFGYYIGHNYTEFGDVANLEQGSVVSVTDSNGDSCDYEVVDSFVVPEGSYWSDISDRVTGYGESVIMQTCVEDGYLIVIAG